MNKNILKLLVAAMCAGCTIAFAEDTKAPAPAAASDLKDQSIHDLIGWNFNLVFSLADAAPEKQKENRQRVNLQAFHYYLLCVGKGALFAPSKEMESILAFQRTKRLADEELLADPWEVGGSLEKLEKVKIHFGGRNYAFKSADEYKELVSDFHRWLKELKFEPRKIDAIKIEPR